MGRKEEKVREGEGGERKKGRLAIPILVCLPALLAEFK